MIILKPVGYTQFLDKEYFGQDDTLKPNGFCVVLWELKPGRCLKTLKILL